MKTLLLIDVQNDFMPNGALPVAGGDEIVPFINLLMPDYDLVIATQDWHPKTHQSFAENHLGKQPFDVIDLHGIEQVLWPVHCVQNTWGAELHGDLDKKRLSAIFGKGTQVEVDSYSAFFDNGKRSATGLLNFLDEREVVALDIVGLAADYCVYYSILDALEAGLSVRLLEQGTRPINAALWQEKKVQLLKNPLFSIV